MASQPAGEFGSSPFHSLEDLMNEHGEAIYLPVFVIQDGDCTLRLIDTAVPTFVRDLSLISALAIMPS
jgi:hypothetical protein